MNQPPESLVIAVMAATKRAPWIGRVLKGLRLECTDQPVVARVGHGVMQANPALFDAYSPAERLGIVAHEALHVLFRHAQRLNDDKDHALNNRAADYAINGYLLGKGFELPSDALYDPQFDEMGARAIRERIRQNQQEKPPSWGGFEPDSRGNNAVADGEAAQAAAGDDAGLQSMISEEFGVAPRESRVSLQRILERLLIMDPEWIRSYRRASRISDDFPSWTEIDARPRTVVCLDTSGSIRPEVREVFVGALAKVLSPVTVIAVDSMLHDAHVWRDVCTHNIKPLREGLPVRGGGTRFQPGIDFARQERANLVYLTDAETGEGKLDTRGVPVTWLVWGDAAIPPCVTNSGRVIRVAA